ncbi:hypothetical protein PMI14_04603 [Acidovorax sp. CF316]|nr:hypothetical protein PMI14_04603 [Acidovorax sp. CF316]
MHIGMDSRPGWPTRRGKGGQRALQALAPRAAARQRAACVCRQRLGQSEGVERIEGPKAWDFTNLRVRRGGEIDEAQRSKKQNKSKVRARVEHVFAVFKRLWGFAKVRYRGLAKNATRSFVVLGLGLANISLARQRLMA